ncbi:MAG: EMC3/TMCO1 family protein [Candidatus Pacearchaeota archaeon]
MLKRTKIALLIMFLSTLIGIFWDIFPFIKNLGHFILDPLIIPTLEFNLTYGFLFFVFLINLFIILVQKYLTDQKSLKKLKEEQRKLQRESKEFVNDPKKMLEFNKKSIELTKDIFIVSMDSWIYTMIPLVLFFRWFNDYFSQNSFQFLGMNWFFSYIVFSIIFSIFLKKIFRAE